MGRRASGTWPCRMLCSGALALLLALSWAGCGGSGELEGAPSGAVVARVGEVSISKTALEHQVAIRTAERPSGLAVKSHRALQREALTELISRQWVLQQAAQRGALPSSAEVNRALARESGASASTRELFLGQLQARGQSLADAQKQMKVTMRVEMQVKLAAAKLRQLALASAPKLSEAQLTAYYATHKQQFAIPEGRYVTVVTRQSRDAALQAKRAVEHGQNIRHLGLYEVFKRRPPASETKRVRAVFNARPHLLIGPVHEAPYYTVFEVVRVTRPRQQSLTEVRSAIAAQLRSERSQRALSSFLTKWRSNWTAHTSCAPAFVVEGCRQHGAPPGAKGPYGLD
jgi:hypothetical protein